MKTFLRRNRTPLILSLIYFVPGVIWVLFSDSLIFDAPQSSEAKEIMQADLIKDLSFVVAVSILIFFLIWFSRKKLITTRLQYQNMFDEHPQPLWIYALDTLRFMAVNKAAIRQYGYSREEFLSMTLADIRPVDEVSLLTAYMESYQPGESRQGLWNHRKKSGEIIVVEIIANDVRFFGKACRLVGATDITERLKKEADINRLSLVAKNATNSVIITDKDARIEWVNEAFTYLTGYTMQEVIGKRPSEFLHGPLTDKTVQDEIFALARQKKSFAGEILNYRKDGSPFWIRLTVSPVINHGMVTNFVTIQTDITAIKDQNSRLKEIAFTASHGFRKPLANIIGLLQFVDEQGTDKQVITDLKKSAAELDAEVRVIVQKTTQVA